MAEIAWADAKRLWESLPERSWAGLMDLLEGGGAGLQQASMDILVMDAGDMDVAGEDFPETPEELYRMLNEAMEERSWV